MATHQVKKEGVARLLLLVEGQANTLALLCPTDDEAAASEGQEDAKEDDGEF